MLALSLLLVSASYMFISSISFLTVWHAREEGHQIAWPVMGPKTEILPHFQVVPAKVDFMKQEVHYARLVITLGFFFKYLNALTSLTCSGGGSTNCVTCDTTKNRLTSTLPSCKCEIGYFDPGSPQCLECHYSWFNILKLTIN